MSYILRLRSYCYIADCASIILTALLNGAPSEAYNCANPDASTTIFGVARVIAECAGRKVVFMEPDSGDISHRTPIAKQVLSSKKIEKLGWKGQFTIHEGIAHTLAILKGD